MISFEKFTLENGLRVVVNTDKTTPIIAFNLLYDVGARDEKPNKTGFAHLFEHLMFGGSVHIPDFDKPLQAAGGESNAYTTNDLTNYYISIPKINLETAFWLESDRMLSLAFLPKSLETQRQVVIEEYKESYLNPPYGDVWLLLRPLAFRAHPYRWATIGMEIEHIEKADLQDVKDFFLHHYAPNNAILSISGDVSVEEVKRLAEKWFAPIPRRDIAVRKLPEEPLQTEARSLTVERDVPYSAIFKVFKMCERTQSDFPISDLLSDVLSNGSSSRLFQRLVKEQQLFSSIDAYLLGSRDAGLFVIAGNLIESTKMEDAERAIEKELELLKNEAITDYEIEKLKNKFESTSVFSEIGNQNRASNLAYFELLGDANLINLQVPQYLKVTAEEVRNKARQIFRKENSSTLYYLAKKASGNKK